MSRTKNRHQAERWLQTAEEDLKAARVLLENGMYAHACFSAQQSGEKAIKALWYLVDAEPWGHSVQRLVAEFPLRNEISDISVWLDHAGFLDQFYIPTRYPNGLPDLTPEQVYRLEDAQRSIKSAQVLFLACKKWVEEYPE